MRILHVDDEPPREILLAATRALPGAVVRHLAPSDDATRALAQLRPDVLLLGPTAASAPDAAERVRALRGLAPELPLVVVSATDGAVAAVDALRAGATDYVPLSAGDALLARRLGEHAAVRRLPHAAAVVPGIAGLVGSSAAMERVRALVHTAARTEAHVLVEGETGTGKEVVARAIHELGPRASRPFVPVNCAAVPEGLAESEFFGHARGAFTGALQERPGALRLADGGTLFLDEIEDLPLALQAKLLRVVQDREVRPLGGSSARRVDVRLVAASNRELWRMVESGAFRRDLYYRLRVLAIALPALRERRTDVPLLVSHFLAAFNRRHGTRFELPPPTSLRPLLEHPWPGNVRELENTLESLCITAHATGAHLAELLRRPQVDGGGLWADERTRILRVLDEHRWNRQRAAAALGISRVTLWRRMERHGIRDPLGPARLETA